MTDQTVGQPTPTTSSPPLIGVTRALAPGWSVRPLGPRTAALVSLAVILALQWHIMWQEGWWPSILFVKDTTYLQIRNCVWRNATYAIFAKGATSHLLIENNE